ncbi:MAG: hypothetical protein ACRDZN_00600 [Acidimicrobiales bacterium]
MIDADEVLALRNDYRLGVLNDTHAGIGVLNDTHAGIEDIDHTGACRRPTRPEENTLPTSAASKSARATSKPPNGARSSE